MEDLYCFYDFIVYIIYLSVLETHLKIHLIGCYTPLYTYWTHVPLVFIIPEQQAWETRVRPTQDK